MTAAGASKLVTISAGTTVILVSLNSMLPPPAGKGELPSMRSLIGAGVTFTVLSAAVDAMPEVAGMFAAAILTTAITLYGVPIMDGYFTHTEPKKVNKK